MARRRRDRRVPPTAPGRDRLASRTSASRAVWTPDSARLVAAGRSAFDQRVAPEVGQPLLLGRARPRLLRAIQPRFASRTLPPAAASDRRTPPSPAAARARRSAAARSASATSSLPLAFELVHAGRSRRDAPPAAPRPRRPRRAAYRGGRSSRARTRSACACRSDASSRDRDCSNPTRRTAPADRRRGPRCFGTISAILACAPAIFEL